MSKKIGFFRKKKFGTSTPTTSTLTSNISLSSSSIYDVNDTINLDIFTTGAVGANIAVVYDLHSAQFANGSNVDVYTVPASGNLSISKPLLAASSTEANVDFSVSIRVGNETGKILDSHSATLETIANVDITASGGNVETQGGINVYTFDSNGTSAFTSYSLTTNFVSGTHQGLDILAIAGGGAGGHYAVNNSDFTCGGGGAGGHDTFTSVIDADGVFAVNVGRGGNIQTTAGVGENGYASQFASLINTLVGGGGGGGYGSSPAGGGGAGAGGASGGGGRGAVVSPPQVRGLGGSNVSLQGYEGSAGRIPEAGGGGGGAGSGWDRFNYITGGSLVYGSQGGDPVYYNKSGANVAYSGGGTGYLGTVFVPGSGSSSIGGGGHANTSGGHGQVICKTARYTKKIVLL